MEKKLELMVKYPDLELYVNWPALESSIRGIREAIDSRAPSVIVQKEIVEIRPAFTQTVNFTKRNYRIRLNKGPAFLHACTLFMYAIHA